MPVVAHVACLPGVGVAWGGGRDAVLPLHIDPPGFLPGRVVGVGRGVVMGVSPLGAGVSAGAHRRPHSGSGSCRSRRWRGVIVAPGIIVGHHAFFWGAARVTTGSPQPHQGTVSSGHMAGALRASGVSAIAATKGGRQEGAHLWGTPPPGRRQPTRGHSPRRLRAVPETATWQEAANHHTRDTDKGGAARSQRRAQARRRTGSHGHQHPPGHGDHSGGTGKTHQRPPLSDRAHRHDKTGPHRSFREHAGTRRKGPFVTATEEKEAGFYPAPRARCGRGVSWLFLFGW